MICITLTIDLAWIPYHYEPALMFYVWPVKNLILVYSWFLLGKIFFELLV